MILIVLKKIFSSMCSWICLRNVKSHGNNVKVNFPCVFSINTIIGDDCHFNGMKIYGDGNVVIGSHFHSGKNCYILTSYHNYDKGKALPYDDTFITRDVIIGDNVWIGLGVTILAGVHIGEGAVIQAGSVVVKDVPSYAVAGGNPCIVFKKRDIAHYNSLKAKQLVVK